MSRASASARSRQRRCASSAIRRARRSSEASWKGKAEHPPVIPAKAARKSLSYQTPRFAGAFFLQLQCRDHLLAIVRIGARVEAEPGHHPEHRAVGGEDDAVAPAEAARPGAADEHPHEGLSKAAPLPRVRDDDGELRAL